MKDVSAEQAKIIKKMVLDKKTNKEIAETTGLKYWEVRDYIQYIGLAGIREEMLGRKPGRRKKDGYNKGKDGPNADRHLCKTCIYRGRHDQVGNCSYIEIEGHSRGMPAAECTEEEIQKVDEAIMLTLGITENNNTADQEKIKQLEKQLAKEKETSDRILAKFREETERYNELEREKGYGNDKEYIRAIAERDVYKSMYMDLLERKMNG